MQKLTPYFPHCVKTWTNADTFCKNQTAKLATIISAEEYDALKSAYQPEHFNGSKKSH